MFFTTLDINTAETKELEGSCTALIIFPFYVAFRSKFDAFGRQASAKLLRAVLETKQPFLLYVVY